MSEDAATQGGGGRPARNGRAAVLFVCLVTSFMAPFMSTALNLCITQISSDFSCGATTVTWVVNAYTLCTAIFTMPP